MRARVLLLLTAGLLISANGVGAAPIPLTVNPNAPITSTNFATVSDAVTFANSNPNNYYDIQVSNGTYTDDFPEVKVPLTIEAVNSGMVTLNADELLPNNKGIILVDSTGSLTVKGLTITGAAIPNGSGGNGAGIRDQAAGGTLDVENTTFSNDQTGILTGGSKFTEKVIVNNSQFINNGNATDPAGQEHALYVTDAASLFVDNSVFCGTDIGHDIKSRAQNTTVENSQLYVRVAGPCGNAGSASIGFDAPNGGTVNLINDLIDQGPNGNLAMTSYGEEGAYPGGSFIVSDSTFDSTANGTAFQQLPNCVTPVISSGNTFNGIGQLSNQPNCVQVVSSAPEPCSIGLLGVALVGFGLGYRNRARRWA